MKGISDLSFFLLQGLKMWMLGRGSGEKMKAGRRERS